MSNETKHTSEAYYCRVCGCDKRHSDSVNADLLEACKAAEAELIRLGDEQATPVWARIRAAIARAEGGK